MFFDIGLKILWQKYDFRERHTNFDILENTQDFTF